MFVYEKRLQYPIKIKNPNPKLAALIITQYGGPYFIRLRKSRSKSLRLRLVYSENTLLNSTKQPLSTLTFATSSRP